ncbi:MAG: hypothetical protein EZS28_050444, partial [Streblomastix strix]
MGLTQAVVLSAS